MIAAARGGALLALLAAASWGGGDFAGGMGAKAEGGTLRGAVRVIVAAHGLSFVVLSAVLFATDGLTLHGAPVAWALASGVVAALSLAAFYMALSQGEMGAAAAVSGLLTAAIPAAISIAREGRPGGRALLGFAFAAVAIWFIAAPSGKHARSSRTAMGLAIGAGFGFGLYFAGLKFANPLGVVEPLVLARVGSLVTCGLLLVLLPKASLSAPSPQPWLSRAGWLWAVGVAVLDSGGNLFYTAATRAGRLDITAVLASLYPASTILLAAALLKERPGPRQLVGMGIAAVAVVLITL